MKDEDGNVIEVRCTVDFDSLSGSAGADRKIKGKTLHWVSTVDAVPFEARLYEPLLVNREDLEADEAEDEETSGKTGFLHLMNPDSLTVLEGVAEPCVKDAETDATFQFLRNGYFCKDPDSTPDKPVYNRTVGLRDSFAKQTRK